MRRHLGYFERVREVADQLEQLSQSSRPAPDAESLERVVAQALALMRDAEWLNLPDEAKAQLTNGLGLNYYVRYQTHGLLPDLQQSIAYFQQTLELVPSAKRRRASVLSNLSAALQLRYSRLGNVIDIEQAVETALQSVQLVPPDLPERPSYLSNLTGALYERYSAYGQINDLDAAINATKQAIALTADDSPRRTHRLNNLAALHQERYSRLGELGDLTVAIRLYQDVIRGTSSDNPNQPIYLNNLGGCLLDLYRRSKVQDHLENAVEALRAAIRNTPIGSPNRPGFLNNLGNALSTLFQKTGEVGILTEAIEVQSEAETHLEGSPLQASFLTSLGSSLVEYYLRTADETSLNRAIEVSTRAIDITPPSSPKLASRWNNLARALMERSKAFGGMEDQQLAQDAYRKACEIGLSLQTEVTLLAGYNWGEWALQRSAWGEATDALQFATLASKELFLRQTLRSDRESWLREAQVLPAMAAYAHAKNGNLTQALKSLETGRTRLLAEMLHLYDTKLEALREGEHSIFFEKYHQAADRVMQFDQGELSTIQSQEAAREARSELSRVIRDIQALPGFDEFFKDPESIDIASILAQSHLDAIVYIIVTSAGGLALIVHEQGFEPVWLDVNSKDLDRIMLGETRNPEKGYLGVILGYVDAPDIIESVCDWLAQIIVKPIHDYLAQRAASKICLIPTGTVALLPLSAGQYVSQVGARPWLQDATITHIPSLFLLQRALGNMGKVGEGPLSLLGIANPSPAPQSLRALKFATDEIRTIANVYKGSTLLLFGEDATVEKVITHLPSTSILHFAGHASFDADRPFDSGMILSEGKRLRVLDLLGKPVFLNSRMAVLSSCQTAMIDFSKIPEEAIGLPAGFLQAGMPAVVSTLWEVDDLSTAMLMIRFYQYFFQEDLGAISEPMKPADALRRAQLWLRGLSAQEIDNFVERFLTTHIGRARLRKDDTFSHPYYWAGFTLSGV
jgi:CHAT domain-containing protein